ncbi:MAG: carbon-monoxide dehydrogenase large subunit [Acidimicrobiales bacterium]|jgi:aerobic carbon-monoxide dehydrogenase large subunit
MPGATTASGGPRQAEDPALLQGTRRFTADLVAQGALQAVFVRSPIASGRIVSIETSEAAAQPGVVAVETGDTIGLAPFCLFPDLPTTMCSSPLATANVRFVGEGVAVILADDLTTATDAADLVDLEIEMFDPVVDPTKSAAAPALYPGSSGNVVYELDDSGNDPIGPEAVHVFETTIVNNRLASAPIECDGIIAYPDGDGLDIWCTSQGVQNIRNQLADNLGMAPERLRVRSPSVGGGFGGRASISPEFVVVCRLALDHQRPVRWIQNRYENLTGMAQGRGYHTSIRMGFDADGCITGIDCDITADAGASAHLSALLMISARRQVPGMYRVPRYRCRATAVLTNTTPVGAYRGAGQPEANHARERVLDMAAAGLGLDPIELRERNLATAEEFPLTSAPGPGHESVVYDEADPLLAMHRARDLIDAGRWRAEQQKGRAEGNHRQIGIGIANYAQTSARGAPVDSALIRVRPDGSILIGCASPSHGQGHLTTWSALVSEKLGIDPEMIEMIDADTDIISTGQATGGSRSTQVAASVLVNTCTDIIEAARPLAAARLEAAPQDLVVAAASHGLAAGLAVAGVPTRRVEWSELASTAPGNCLEATRSESVAGAAHPYGTHATVVEVDTETGAVRLLAHAAVDDCGEVLQPALVEGQQHGGVAAGLGQTLYEDIGFDGLGNPLAATFATYLLPAAAEFCDFQTETLGTPTDRNPLGTRGIGENGCNAATGSAHNAVLDALAGRGIQHIDLPLTPEKIWRSLQT